MRQDSLSVVLRSHATIALVCGERALLAGATDVVHDRIRLVFVMLRFAAVIGTTAGQGASERDIVAVEERPDGCILRNRQSSNVMRCTI